MKTIQQVIDEIDKRIKIADVIDILESSRAIVKYELLSLKAWILSEPDKKCEHLLENREYSIIGDWKPFRTFSDGTFEGCYIASKCKCGKEFI